MTNKSLAIRAWTKLPDVPRNHNKGESKPDVSSNPIIDGSHEAHSVVYLAAPRRFTCNPRSHVVNQDAVWWATAPGRFGMEQTIAEFARSQKLQSKRRQNPPQWHLQAPQA